MLDSSRSMALVGLLAALGCSSSGAEKFSTSSAAIEGGQLDEDHHAVFFLLSAVGAACTSTLIAPNLLLTARHCVSPVDDERVICGSAGFGKPYDGRYFLATNDPEPTDSSRQFRGKTGQVYVPSEGSDTCGFDMAMIILSSNVPSSVATPAVPRIDQPAKEGETYSAIGYGVDADGRRTDGRMLLNNLSVYCSPGQCGFGVESTEFMGDHGTCSGDSGGPALDTAGRVIGVVSRAGPDCGTPVYGGVNEWRDWIVSIAKKAAELGAYDPPSWVLTGKTEPPEGVEPKPPTPTEPEPPPNVDPTPPKGNQGESCRTTDECGDSYACYSPDGTASGAYCAARCSGTTGCAAGSSCDSQLGVCLSNTARTTSDSGESSGCAVNGRSAPVGGAWLGLGLLGLVALRRRARS